jgi:WD40 repeat protein
MSPADKTEDRGTLLDKLEQGAKVFSLVAIPVVIPIALAIYSARIQEASERQTIDRDYVELAVSILKEHQSDVSPGLRDWAVNLLNEHSPTKFQPDVLEKLTSGEISLVGKAADLGSTWAISPNHKIVASGRAKRIILRNTVTGSEIDSFPVNGPPVGMDFSPDGKLFAAAEREGVISVWNVEAGTRVALMNAQEQLSSLRFSGDGKVFVIGAVGEIIIFDGSGRLIGRVVPPNAPTGLTGSTQ